MKRIMKILIFVAALLYTGNSGSFILAAYWNPLPDTSQTKCYDVSGNEIACPAAGQLHGQDAQYYGPEPSYIANGTGTVRDNNTDLIWQQNTADTNGDGSITSTDYPNGDRMTWQDAVDYCAGLYFGGSGDWHLPSYTELESIVDYGLWNPAINTIFSCEQIPHYWTATTNTPNTDSAWIFDFYNGYDGTTNKMNHNYIRCVRNSSTGGGWREVTP